MRPRAPLLAAALLAALGGCARRSTGGGPQPDAAPEFAAPDPADRPDAALLRGDLVPDWVAADTSRTYLPDDLHLLVNGGDGVFLRYGFAWAARRTYRTARPTNRRVRVELYAFSSDAGARARFDHESREGGGEPWSKRPPPDALAGLVAAGRLDADELRLARGRFLAVVRYEDDAESDPRKLVAVAAEPLLAFGAAVAEACGGGRGTAGGW